MSDCKNKYFWYTFVGFSFGRDEGDKNVFFKLHRNFGIPSGLSCFCYEPLNPRKMI